MTITFHVGRRIPRSWARRTLHIAGGLLSFQENIWIMIKQSLTLAKKKATQSNTGVKFVINNHNETEDLNYEIQWIKVIIQGTKAQEEEEYNDIQNMYSPFGKIFKKDMPKDERLKKHFKTKILTTGQVDEAYKKGMGVISDNNLANKLLEMGILTHVEKIDDYNSRDSEFSKEKVEE